MENFILKNIREQYGTTNLFEIAKLKKIIIWPRDLGQNMFCLTVTENSKYYVIVNKRLDILEQERYIKRGILTHLMFPHTQMLFTEQNTGRNIERLLTKFEKVEQDDLLIIKNELLYGTVERFKEETI